MSGSLSTFGVVEESTYGTAVSVDKFFEIRSEEIRGEYPRIESESLGGALVQRADRFAVNPKGSEGSVELEVLTKGFGFWLPHLLGDVEISGPEETDAYTHTATMADLYGKSFTVQVGRPYNNGTLVPFTYPGGKITSVEFSNSVDEILVCTLEMDFQSERGGAGGGGGGSPYSLKSASYPAGAELMTYAGGTIKIAGSAVDVYECSVSIENNLKTDAYVIRKGADKKEPYQDAKREVTFSVTVPFESMDHYNRIAAETASAASTSLELRWEGPTLLGSTIYPSLTISIPVARFDEGIPTVEGEEALQMELSGVGLYDGTNSPVTIEYVTADEDYESE